MTRAFFTQVFGLVGLLSLLAAGGCAGFEKSPFLQRHFSSRQQSSEAAEARWNNVRGDVRRQMASDQLKAGNVAEAGRLIGEALAMSPQDAEALRLQARILLLQDQLETAAAAADRAVQLDDASAEGHYLFGLIAERRGNTDACVAAYQRAVERDRDAQAYTVALARALVAAGAEARASQLIAQQCEQFVQSVDLHLLGMDLARQQNRAPQAVRYANTIARIALDDIDARARAGVVLAWAGEHKAAIVLLNEVIETVEGDDWKALSVARPLVVRVYARCCAELGDFDAALAVLKPLLRDCPNDAVAWSLFCRVAISAGDTDTAWAAVHTFNKRNVADADMLLLEALICFQKGRRGKAIALADAAMQADPNCATAARELRRRAGDIDATMPSIVFFSSARNDTARAGDNAGDVAEEVRRR